MREIRKKQKKLYKAMRILLYAAIAVLVVYIGAEPLVAKASHVAALVMNYVCDALVIASMFMLLMYYSKYGKWTGISAALRTNWQMPGIICPIDRSGRSSR